MLNYECKVENKSAIARELTISIPTESVQAYMDEQFKSLQKKAKVKGFRQGKVPMTLLRQYYLQDVKSDVFSRLLTDGYMRAVQENNLNAIGRPEIVPVSGTNLDGNEPLTFKARIEILPEIKVGDLSKIKLKRKAATVAAKDLEESLNNLRDSHSEMIPDADNKGPVKKGDFVEITFSGTVDGKDHPILKAANRLVEVGSGNYREEFEAELVGMKTGEEKEFDFTLPPDLEDKALLGKTARMKLMVHEFKKKQLPELSDEFAKLFKFEKLDDLKADIEKRLKEQRTQEADDSLKEELLKTLVAQNTFDVPSSLVKTQYEYIEQQYAQRTRGQKFTADQEKEMQKIAEEQVRASLLMQKVAEEQSIRIEPADLDHEYEQVSQNSRLPADSVRKYYEGDAEAMRTLRFRLREKRTIDYLLGQVQVSEAK